MDKATCYLGGLVMIETEALASWVRSTCEAQGVPVHVTDVRVVRSIGVLLTGEASRATADARQRRQTGDTLAGSSDLAPEIPGRMTA